jgi:hypothetical protein
MNSQNTLSEAPTKLTENNVSVTNQIESFSHQDEALKAVATEMTKDALDSLPDGEILPITFAFADVSASQPMGAFITDSYILGNAYDINLRSAPVVTTKSLKMGWYDTTTDEPLELEEIMDEVQSWGWDKDETENTMKLFVVWNQGETKIIKIDTHETNFESPEKNEVLSWIKRGVGGLNTLAKLPALITFTCAFFFYWHIVGWTGKSFKTVAHAAKAFYGVIRGIKVAPEGISCIEKIIGQKLNMKTWGGKFSKCSRIAKGLWMLGIVIGVGIAFYAWYQIASQGGWEDRAMAIGGVYFIISVLYILALELIALISGGVILVSQQFSFGTLHNL